MTIRSDGRRSDRRVTSKMVASRVWFGGGGWLAWQVVTIAHFTTGPGENNTEGEREVGVVIITINPAGVVATRRWLKNRGGGGRSRIKSLRGGA